MQPHPVATFFWAKFIRFGQIWAKFGQKRLHLGKFIWIWAKSKVFNLLTAKLLLYFSKAKACSPRSR